MKMFVCRFPIRWLSVVNRAFGFGLSGLEANPKKKKTTDGHPTIPMDSLSSFCAEHKTSFSFRRCNLLGA